MRELITQDSMRAIAELDDTIRTSRAAIRKADDSDSPTLKALMMARATNEIRRQLTADLMTDVMSLVGSPLGFRTDKDGKQGYPVEVVRDCLIEAFMRGLRPVGNEFNIIASRLYVTKEGLRRLVREWPGLTDLKLTFGVPRLSTDKHGALVSATARWKVHDQPDEILCDGEDGKLPVRVNEAMGTDAILGKAESKLYRRIYQRLSGSEIASADEQADAAGVVDGTFTSSTEQPAAEQQKTEDPRPDVWPKAEGNSPLDFAAAEFAECVQLGDVARTHRNLVQSYPDYQDQIDELSEFHKTRIRKSRGPRANKLFDDAPTAQTEGV